MNSTKKYVLGFLFDEPKSSVVLIRKNKPEWQRGLLNGVGGKVEGDEPNWYAMYREFKEETGVDDVKLQWEEFANLSGDDWAVVCFKAFNSNVFTNVKTNTDEEIVKIQLDSIQNYNVISNLKWLIHVALDENYGSKLYANVRYSNPFKLFPQLNGPF